MAISKKFTQEFSRIKDLISEAYIAVGMITDPMYEYFLRSIPTQTTIKIITGVHMRTTPSVLNDLKVKTQNNRLEAKVYSAKYFHPKLYLFKTGNDWMAFVGSGNFTNGGWYENEELFVTISDQDLCKDLKDKFDAWFVDAKDITDHLIGIYTENFYSNQRGEIERQRNTRNMIDNLQQVFNLDNIDFTNQFFRKEHYLAFEPGITHLDTLEVLDKRRRVVNRFHELNEMLLDEFPAAWDIHEHYMAEHIVSSIYTHIQPEDNVRAMWLAYGRSHEDLKKYGESATPMNFIRLQVIIHYNNVGIWLMPGKANGSEIDRSYFLEQIRNSIYAQEFYHLLTDLGNDYWIEVAEKQISVSSFSTLEDLIAHVQRDNWKEYYFIIGRNYSPGATELSETNIVATIVHEFGRLYPLYQMMKHSF